MQFLMGVLQVAVAVTFVAAATGKLLRPDEFEDAMRRTKLPSRPLMVAVPTVEVLLALSLLVASGGPLQLAFMSATAVLMIFTVWVAWVMSTRRVVRCGCFGASRHSVGHRALLRNCCLVMCAVAGVWLAGQTLPVGRNALPSKIVIATSGGLAVMLLTAARQVLPTLILSRPEERPLVADSDRRSIRHEPQASKMT